MTTKVTTTKTVVQATTTVAELNVSIESAIARFNEAKDTIKVLELQKKQAEEEIRELMGSAEIGTVNGVERVKISTRTRSDINKDDLKAVFPEAYELCLKSSTYTVVTAVSNN